MARLPATKDERAPLAWKPEARSRGVTMSNVATKMIGSKASPVLATPDQIRRNMAYALTAEEHSTHMGSDLRASLHELEESSDQRYPLERADLTRWFVGKLEELQGAFGGGDDVRLCELALESGDLALMRAAAGVLMRRHACLGAACDLEAGIERDDEGHEDVCALHQIADILADAMEANEREERVAKRKGTPRKPPHPGGESTPAEAAAAREFLGRKA